MSINSEPYDPRGVANLLLDAAASEKIFLTNLALQKLLYFMHSLYLIETKGPLISGYFEAWKYGPVHPTVYNCFKIHGNNLIESRAMSIKIISGTREKVIIPENHHVRRVAMQVVSSYGHMSPGRLVEVSHARGAPWHYVVSNAASAVAFGMRIPNDVILERFKHHKVTLGAEPRYGEPGEESPYTRD